MSKGGKKKKYIQIGMTALRDPATGGFLPSVPLYIEATEEAEEAEAAMVKDIGRVFAGKMKQYIEGGGVVGGTSPAKEKTQRRT